MDALLPAVHVRRDQFHLAWDRSIEPIATVGSGDGLSAIDAYLLCSVACDLKISEIVDAPNWIVTSCCPLSIFG